MMSDIDIAQQSKMRPIAELAQDRLGKVPSSNVIDVSADGQIVGLF